MTSYDLWKTDAPEPRLCPRCEEELDEDDDECSNCGRYELTDDDIGDERYHQMRDREDEDRWDGR